MVIGKWEQLTVSYCINNIMPVHPLSSPKQIMKLSPKHSPSSGNSSSAALSHIKSTPNSPDDINTSLLRNSDDPVIMNGNMFGKFKGFTLRPLQELTSSNSTNNFPSSNIAYVTPVAKSPPPVPESPREGLSKSPVRAAPAVPKIPIGRSQSSQSKGNNQTQRPVAKITRAGTSVNDKIAKFDGKTSPPALPPLNPGSNARPLISSPILESSTSSAKEMLSPNKNGKQIVPVRPAPVGPPAEIVPEDITNKPLPPIAGNKEKGSTLQRIKSFMNKKEEKQNYERKVPKFIDRNRLKTIEISAPIPQMETQNEINNRKSLLARTQSMRNSYDAEKQPESLQSFGSMRWDESKKRPISIVNSRPKSPPPPRPPAPPTLPPSSMKIPGLPGYQNPPPPKKVVTIKTHDDYDDCDTSIGEAPLARISEDNSPVSPDNIYSVIDEGSFKNIDLRPNANDTSLESIGLLGEIVNEIDNINLDSIYSATTLKRQTSKDDSPRYANTDEGDDSEEYGSNLKSNVSTTSSGYLRPSAINMPVARVAPSQQPTPPELGKDQKKNAFSSFKSGPSNPVGTVKPLTNESKVDPKAAATCYKPYHSSINRPFASQYSTPNNQNSKKSNEPEKVKTAPKLTRTVTPPNLRTKTDQKPVVSKPDPKPVKEKPKPQTAIKPVVKPPINNAKPPSVHKSASDPAPKPKQLTNGTTAAATEVPATSSSSSNSKVLQKAATTNRHNPKLSNVASLQKKFEPPPAK